MSVLELNDEQVVSMVRQLPAARKRTALLALAPDAQAVKNGCSLANHNYAASPPSAGWSGIE
jgi:hypothetical protein